MEICNCVKNPTDLHCEDGFEQATIVCNNLNVIKNMI